MNKNQVARGVRVKLNLNWKPNSLSDEYLQKEPVILIADEHIYNDVEGEYVFISGGSKTNSGTAYLTELDLEFPFTDGPVYSWENPPQKGSYTEHDVKTILSYVFAHPKGTAEEIKHKVEETLDWFNNPKDN